MQHDPPPWKQGNTPDSIIVTMPPEGGHRPYFPDIEPDYSDLQYYGGKVICESVAPQNRALIMASPKLYEVCQMWLSICQSASPKQMAEIETVMRDYIAEIDKE